MRLKQYLKVLSIKGVVFRIQCGIKDSVKGKIVLLEDDFLILRTENTLGSGNTLGDAKTLGDEEILIPYSAICTVLKVDEEDISQCFIDNE